jgi:hypothetical protein
VYILQNRLRSRFNPANVQFRKEKRWAECHANIVKSIVVVKKIRHLADFLFLSYWCILHITLVIPAKGLVAKSPRP